MTVRQTILGKTQPRSLTVELCGIPGAGKTHLVAELVDLMREGPVLVRDASLPAGRAGTRERLRRKAGLVGWFAATSPLVAFGTARAVADAGLRPREQLARTVNLLAAAAVVRASGPGVTLLDQGVVQEIGSIGLTGDAGRCLVKLALTRLRSPDLIVLLEAAPDIAAQRLRARATGESRIEQLKAADQRAQLEQQALDLVALARRWVDARVGTELWIVPARHDADTARSLADRIEQRIVQPVV